MHIINELCGPRLCWTWPTLIYIWTKLWAHFSVWAKLHHSVIMSRPSLHTTQSSIWQVPWVLPAGVKMLESRFYHSPPFSVKVLAAMKTYLQTDTHFLVIVLAYEQRQIYIHTVSNTTKKVHIEICAFILITNSVPTYLFRPSSGRWYWRMYYIECQKTVWCVMWFLGPTWGGCYRRMYYIERQKLCDIQGVPGGMCKTLGECSVC